MCTVQTQLQSLTNIEHKYGSGTNKIPITTTWVRCGMHGDTYARSAEGINDYIRTN